MVAKENAKKDLLVKLLNPNDSGFNFRWQKVAREKRAVGKTVWKRGSYVFKLLFIGFSNFILIEIIIVINSFHIHITEHSKRVLNIHFKIRGIKEKQRAYLTKRLFVHKIARKEIIPLYVYHRICIAKWQTATCTPFILKTSNSILVP